MKTLALILVCGYAFGQGPATIVINQSRVNGGISGDFLKVNPNGTVGQGAGGGGGTCPSGSANTVQKTNGTNCAASQITDNGTNVGIGGAPTFSFSGSGNVQATGSIVANADYYFNRTNHPLWGYDVGGAVPWANNFVLADVNAYYFGVDTSNSNVSVTSGTVLGWSNSISAHTAKDTGIAKNAAGVIEINDGTAGTYRDLKLRSETINGTVNYCESSTGSDTYTCSITPALSSYTSGQCVIFKPTGAANTGAATININSLGAKSILTSSGVDPGDGVIAIGSIYQLCYDGTEFLLPQDQQGSGTTVLSLTGSNSLNGKYIFQKLTLTGDTTISSITNIKNGVLYAFVICQDGSGSHSFTWPASVLGGMTIGSTASKCNTQTFAADGTSLFASTPGVINE